MNLKQMKSIFKNTEDEYLEFDRIPADRQRSGRPDLHAFLLLDELVPGDSDIVSASSHDEFFLDIDVAKLAKKITEEQVIELVRCGVRLDDDDESLCMFA